MVYNSISDTSSIVYVSNLARYKLNCICFQSSQIQAQWYMFPIQSDTSSMVYVSNLVRYKLNGICVQSSEIPAQLYLCPIQLDTSSMVYVSKCMQDLCTFVQMAGKLKVTFFRDQFTNLKFIYYSKRVGDNYWID